VGEDREEGGRSLTRRGRLVLWAPVLLLLVFEFYLSSRPASAFPDIFHGVPQADKLEHAGYFLLTGFLAYRAGRYGERWSRSRAVTWIVLAAVAWGVSDEFHQSFVPTRSVEAADVAADVVGAFLGALAGEPLSRLLGLDRVRP